MQQPNAGSTRAKLLVRVCALVQAAFGCVRLCCGVVVGGFLLSGSFYMCPAVECILCSKNVYTTHCMKQ